MAESNIGKLCRKESDGRLAYCKREGNDAGMLIFYTGKFGYLRTSWTFDQPPNYNVDAYINGNCVCHGHSPQHIVDYDVISDALEIVQYENGDMGYRFTMSITGVVGRCVFRCWRVGTDYEKADSEMRAEVVGTGNTVARFELLKRTNYTWSVHVI